MRETVNTYKLEECSSGRSFYRLKRMGEIFDQTAGTTDHPHRHDYYTIVWVMSGQGKHIIDFREYRFEQNAVFFISPGQIHQVVAESRPTGWVITFSKEFLQQHHISESFIKEINLFNHFDERPPIILSTTRARQLQQYLEDALTLSPDNVKHQIAAFSAYLKLFLVYCDEQCDLDRSDADITGNAKAIWSQFKSLVEAHFREYHKVGEYAELMHLHAKYLNQVVKSSIGQTAKAVIQEKVILNAKRELKYSSKSVKEIGYELGFDDPLYFSAFFKKCTGMPPTRFRKMA